MKRIPLTQGKIALVDDADYVLVQQFKWCASYEDGRWYAIARVLGESRNVRMHRLIAGDPPFKMDHRNCNGLDNRRLNLRPATTSENGGNSRRARDNTSGAKGVCWDGRYIKPWRARIKIARASVELGRYLTLEAAARAYRRAAKLYFGEFARAA